MQIEFRTRRLERNFLDVRRAIQQWGPSVGERYAERLTMIGAAPSVDALYTLPALRFHQLAGDRKGQFAASLTGQWRVIPELVNDETLRVVSVEDYHG